MTAIARKSLPQIEWCAQTAGVPSSEVRLVAAQYPVLVSPFLRKRIEQGTYSLTAARQYLPNSRELEAVAGWVVDPCKERNHKAADAVIQKYENRVALLLTHKCLVYCRYCFRKDFVGQDSSRAEPDALEEALDFLAQTPTVSDVLLSGGDPLALPNSRLLPFLERLVALPHIKVIRIHSRALSVSPGRFDDDLMAFLERHRQFWYYGHMNHPDDVTHEDVTEVAQRLHRIGVPVLNQAVILGGVNDDPETMADLHMQCYERRIMPYNLYMLDRVRGATHFAVSLDRVVEIAARLGRLPGPAQPTLVVVDSDDRKHRMCVESSPRALRAWLERLTNTCSADTAKD